MSTGQRKALPPPARPQAAAAASAHQQAGKANTLSPSASPLPPRCWRLGTKDTRWDPRQRDSPQDALDASVDTKRTVVFMSLGGPVSGHPSSGHCPACFVLTSGGVRFSAFGWDLGDGLRSRNIVPRQLVALHHALHHAVHHVVLITLSHHPSRRPPPRHP